MSTAPINRHPLGLPAGSVRALLALAITAMFWIYVVAVPTPVPLYLYFLLALVPAFFAGHGVSIAQSGPNPLYLPRGTIRGLLLAISLGVLVWQLTTEPDALKDFEPAAAELKDWPLYFLALVGGCSLGWLIGRGPWRNWPAFQDIQAWLSLLALFAFAIEIVIDLVIKPQSPLLAERQIWHALVIGIIGFYFASRS